MTANTTANMTAKWIRSGMLLLSLLLLPAVGCIEDNPYYPPQGSTSAGPRGSAAFLSGEASRTGLSPVKEGGLDAGLTDSGGQASDAGGGGDGATTTPETVEGFNDLLVPNLPES